MKMVGKVHEGKSAGCSCCIPMGWKKRVKRSTKRRERQQWKKEVQAA